MILGLTGSLGSGKSTVSAMLRQLGARIICADELAKEVVAPGTPALKEIVRLFGPSVVDSSGQLDRKAVAGQVFADPRKRRLLEGIVHPKVRERELALLEVYRDHPLVVLDVPLLYEAGMESLCDKVMVVTVSPDARRERLVRERGMSEEEIEGRLAAQLPQDEKSARADFVIGNSGSLEETRSQVQAVVASLFPRGISA